MSEKKIFNSLEINKTPTTIKFKKTINGNFSPFSINAEIPEKQEKNFIACYWWEIDKSILNKGFIRFNDKHYKTSLGFQIAFMRKHQILDYSFK